MTFRVIVTGSRNWPDRDAVWAALDELAARHGGDLVVVHGACPTGADAHADEWAIDRRVRCARWRADWRVYGRAAGPLRNQAMVEAGAGRRGRWTALSVLDGRAFPSGSGGVEGMVEMGLEYGSIVGGMDVMILTANTHGECAGCAATLAARLDGAMPKRDVKELLQELGLVPAGRSRVRRMVDAGATNAEILAVVPGATDNDCLRARREARGECAR